MSSHVTILMATYNGERFLDEQIASLEAQTHEDWELCARDDGSHDGTAAILRRAARRDPRIHVLDSDGCRRGSNGNFAALLDWACSHGPPDGYVMFCDQDDVWRPEKIGITLNAMRRVEAGSGQSTPVLVHTDFEFVDENLKPLGTLAPVARRLSSPEGRLLNRLLSQNFIYGCTMMLNRELVHVSAPIPAAAEQHDYWVALVAAAVGRIAHVQKSTVLYRQHRANVTPGLGAARVLPRVRRLLTGWEEAARINRNRYAQAETLADRLGGLLPPERRRLLQGYREAMARGAVSAVWFAWRYGLRRQGALQTARYLLTLLSEDSRPHRTGSNPPRSTDH